MAASFAIAVGERRVVRQTMKAVEVLASKRERTERLGQVDERPLLFWKPGRQVHTVGNVPEAHPHRRLRGRSLTARAIDVRLSNHGSARAAPAPRSMVRRVT